MSYEDRIIEVARAFGVTDALEQATQIHEGHINLSYLTVFAGNKYLVQKVNKYVFKDPITMMHNIEKVTHYLRKQIRAENGDPERGTVRFLRTEESLNYYIDNDGEFWRMSVYIDGAKAYSTVQNTAMLYNAGCAIGRFQRMLSDFPMENLKETIKDFHNTPKRFDSLFNTAEEDPVGKAKNVESEIQFFRDRYNYVSRIIRLQNDGIIPSRVVHNDTKYNNILIDDITMEAVALIDLDTVMPGISCYDFGDAVRYATNTAAEDEKDLSLVKFNIQYYEAFTRGFIGTTRYFFTDAEIDNMSRGAIIMTLECGARFLEDYIKGDVYFAVEHPDHNLERARNQMKLATEMENQYFDMVKIVNKYR